MKKLATVLLCAAFALAVGCKKDDKKKPDPKPDPKPEGKKPDPTPDPTPDPVPDPVPDTSANAGSWHTPDDVKYAPLDPKEPDGIQVFPVRGNPAEGASAMYFKVPGGGNPGIHSHTAGYHAVVLKGKHKHWLPGDKKIAELGPGGYWYQPGGQPHGDHCVSKEPCEVFIVFEGKLDMTPNPDVKETKDRGKYKLVKAADAKFGPMPEGPVKLAPLWGDMKAGASAFAIQMPKGFENPMHKHSASYHAVVLAGTGAHWLEDGKHKDKAMPAGSHWYQPAGQFHRDACRGDADCKAWVFVNGPMDFTPKDPPADAPKDAPKK